MGHATQDSLLSVLRKQVADGMLRRDDGHLKAVFEKHKDPSSELVPRENLRAALAALDVEVDEKDLEEILFSSDSHASGGLDLEDFKRAVRRPLMVQQWAGDLPLAQMVADAMPRAKGLDPLRAVSKATAAVLRDACQALSEGLLKVLEVQVAELKTIFDIQDEAKSNAAAAKFEHTKMSAGDIVDFYAGLGNRIGP